MLKSHNHLARVSNIIKHIISIQCIQDGLLQRFLYLCFSGGLFRQPKPPVNNPPSSAISQYILAIVSITLMVKSIQNAIGYTLVLNKLINEVITPHELITALIKCGYHNSGFLSSNLTRHWETRTKDGYIYIKHDNHYGIEFIDIILTISLII